MQDFSVPKGVGFLITPGGEYDYPGHSQINNLQRAAEDIITLTFGNVFIVIDKTINGIVIIVSIILLAIGLIIVALILILKKGGMGTPQYIGIGFFVIFTIFFLCVILITPLRANILMAFNYGAKTPDRETTPMITKVVPKQFKLGEDDRITIYGRNLNLIPLEELKIALYQNTTEKKVFPASTIIMSNAYHIILGNLNSSTELGWNIIKYREYENFIQKKDPTIKPEGIRNYSKQFFDPQVNNVIRKKLSITQEKSNTIPRILLPSYGLAIEKEMDDKENNTHEIRPLVFPMNIDMVPFRNSGTTTFATIPTDRLRKLKDLLVKQRFQIDEGSYGLRVYHKTQQIESSQLITFQYPPPPLPNADIYPISGTWKNTAIVNESTDLIVDIGLLGVQEINADFYVSLKSVNFSGVNKEVKVYQAEAMNALSAGTLKVRFPGVKVPRKSGNRFKITVDSKKSINEVSETNNEIEISLDASTYVYDATITFTSFDPLSNLTWGTDHYELKLLTWINPDKKIKFEVNKKGEPKDNWTINYYHKFTDLRVGQVISYYSTAKETHFQDDDMGVDLEGYSIPYTPPSKYDFVLSTKHYRVTGHIKVERRIVN